MLVALVVKGGMLLFQFGHADHGEYSGLWGSVGGDTRLYLEPIDNLLSTGHYDPDYRMPGYGFIYFFLRVVFDKVMALNVLVLLQYVAAALSVYALALMARKIFKWQGMFYITYYLFLISTYSNLEDGTVLTESFSTSFMVFVAFFAIKWYETYGSIYLILSGALLTEVIFLRPVYAPLILLFLIFIAATCLKNGKAGSMVKYLTLFMIPFILIDGAWIIRNYGVHKRVIPLTTVTFLKSEDTKLFWSALGFMQAWGGNYIAWDPNSEMRYFNIKEHLTKFHSHVMQNTYKPFPPDIYTSAFNADSLAALKAMVIQIDNDTNPVSARQLTNIASAKFDTFALSVKKEKPFVYYIKAPLRIAKIFLIHPGTYNLFPKAASQLNKFELAIKVFYSLFYVLGLLLGLGGVLLMAKKSFYIGPEFLVSGILVYTVVIHPLVLRLCEARYFMPAWPFLLVCVAYSLYIAREKVLNKIK